MFGDINYRRISSYTCTNCLLIIVILRPSFPSSFAPSKIETARNYLQLSCIAFRFTVRRTLLIPTHVRLSESPFLPRPPPRTLFCRGVLPSQLYKRRACLLDVEEDYMKKERKREKATDRKTKRVSEYLVWPCTPDSSGLRSSLVTNRTQRRG